MRDCDERTPTESVEQQCLMRWARAQAGAMPELRNLIHIPNEGKRTNGGRLIAEGMRAGVSDLFLPTARGGYHGLWIELKRVKGGRVSDAQAEWIRAMREEGYAARVCFGWVDAMETIMKYMRGEEIDQNGEG